MSRLSCWNRRLHRWYRVDMAPRALEHFSIEEAQAQLKNLVKGIRQYGVRGGPITIGEHEPEVVVISRSRYELIMDLLKEHGGLEELAQAERDATPTDAEVRAAAEQLGIEVPADLTA